MNSNAVAAYPSDPPRIFLINDQPGMVAIMWPDQTYVIPAEEARMLGERLFRAGCDASAEAAATEQ